MGERRYEAWLDGAPEDALAALAAAVEAWGGEVRERRPEAVEVALPTSAGLHWGITVGTVAAEAAGDGSRLVWTTRERSFQVQRGAVFFLVLGALGAAAAVVAPFVPRLLPLLPAGLLLAFAGWLLIVARLSNSGPEELMESLADGTPGAEAAPAD